MEFENSLEPKICRFDIRDELTSGDKMRLKLFVKRFPSIFNNSSYEDVTSVNHYQAFNILKNYYYNNDREGYITLLIDVRYFLLPIDNETFSPAFMWEMMVKYEGNLSLVTNADRRKWKIKEILK